MNDLAVLLSQILLGWLAIQVFLSLIFLWNLRFNQSRILPDEKLPKTAIVLCLRGADPFLPNCLRALLNQNYPQYDLKLIVDRQEDPAWKIAIDTIQELGATNVQISSLRFIRKNCSLKCSSLVQAVSELDESYQVIALVDADTVVHSNWLRELVSPLANPHIGATTGNRWYLPTGKYCGSLVRYIWNVSAVVQMYLYGIPWGGTLAVKTQVLHQTGLVDKWSKAFGEDTMMRSVLGKNKYKVKFVPSLIMLNREESDLPSLRYWLQRQLLASRLYHPWWLAVVGDTILTILLPSAIALLALAALFTQQWQTAIFSFSCYCGYMLALLLLLVTLEKEIQQVLQRQGEAPSKLLPATIFKIFLGIPFTQWVYGLAMLSSFWMPTVKWRGITYEIKGPWNLQLLDYRPYKILDQPSDRKISL
ncbi:glycosyltransferase family 2 protein [Tolypothrix sp. FACHB-123]|uniref:glycosyltransferase n=1 Tax=Tolypothrix sp. FACHB-123 TaxID=2692868 RepID=UPI0016873C72|nr:glycosyltransferase family 2 protein [Tolypothrix sp. FACHB-123]MBD2355323.1 glycosyltransferase family 2 protein [Tolypothrix sp. FACHB-123]